MLTDDFCSPVDLPPYHDVKYTAGIISHFNTFNKTNLITNNSNNIHSLMAAEKSKVL